MLWKMRGDFRCILANEIVGKQEVVVQNMGEGGWINSECIVGGAIMADGAREAGFRYQGIFSEK